MEKKFKLGVIGAGFMSTAIINGAIKSKFLDAKNISVTDISEDAINRMKEIGVFATQSLSDVINSSEFVLFAVKPQNFSDLDLSNCSCNKFISIMAGVKKDKIKSHLKKEVKVARCMPNTPCSIGKGSVGLDCSDYTNKSDCEFIKGLLSSFASVVVVEEKKLNAVTGVSGSSPAYFYLFLKCIIDSGIKNGLTENESKTLALNTMIGAGEMVKTNPEKSIEDLIRAVCSKGGTTIEAIQIFEDSDLKGIVDNAVSACIKRSKELEEL